MHLESEKSGSIEEVLEGLCQEYLGTHGILGLKDLETLLQKTLLHVSFSHTPNISQLCSALDVSRNTLKKKLKELGIVTESD